WYRHRWRTNGGFTIYLGVMLADDALVFAHQPLTGYRETAVTVGFVNTRGLQQRQGAAAGTEEHEAGIDGLLVAAVAVFHFNKPAAVIGVVEVVHFMVQQQAEMRVVLQTGDHVAGERAKI